jgi:phosphoribosylformimino-5-aminoimidazole carboxamide ribotide isomerase
MRAIPAIDLLDGNVVRLKKGDFAQVTVYDRDPLQLAHLFAESGLTHLHVVDLNGARDGHFAHLRLIESIVRETGLIVQAGGGIRRFDDLATLFDAGIRYAVSSSMAMNAPGDWSRALTTYGDRCVFGMDLKDGHVAISGWLETRDVPLTDVLTPMIASGLRHVLCTDISRDGMLSGANHDLYRRLMAEWPELLFTASGGVADADDLERLSAIGVHAVVVGRAYFEKRIQLETLSRYTHS